MSVQDRLENSLKRLEGQLVIQDQEREECLSYRLTNEIELQTLQALVYAATSDCSSISTSPVSVDQEELVQQVSDSTYTDLNIPALEVQASTVAQDISNSDSNLTLCQFESSHALTKFKPQQPQFKEPLVVSFGPLLTLQKFPVFVTLEKKLEADLEYDIKGGTSF